MIPSEAHLLSLTWMIPAMMIFMSLFMNKDNHRSMKTFNLLGHGINFILIVYLLFRYMAQDTSESYHFIQTSSWFALLNINYTTGVDGISMLMMLLTGIVIICGIFASWGVKDQAKEFFILLNVLVAGVYGVFISLDLFTLFLFYEVAVLPMYLLIGVWGTGKKEYSAMKLTIMLVAGSAFLLAGILALYFESGVVSGTASFNLIELSNIHFPVEFQNWVFPFLFLGFGVLGAMFPFHTWSPDGHASAPTAVSMLHAGVLMKLGGYGCLRVAMFILPEGCREWMPFFLVLVTANVVYGAFAALKQTDLKYVTAYSSVSHCGFVLFGFAALTPMGLQGGVLQMISHGLMTALFFCLIGMIYGRTHTRVMSEMGGLMKVIPFLGVAFVITGLAGLGLPGLSGFVAELTIFIGAFAAKGMLSSVCAILAIFSIVVTAVYVLRTANTMLGGPLNEKYADLKDASFVEKLPVVILLFCLFAMGIFPAWIVQLVQQSVDPIYQNIMR